MSRGDHTWDGYNDNGEPIKKSWGVKSAIKILIILLLVFVVTLYIKDFYL